MRLRGKTRLVLFVLIYFLVVANLVSMSHASASGLSGRCPPALSANHIVPHAEHGHHIAPCCVTMQCCPLVPVAYFSVAPLENDQLTWIFPPRDRSLLLIRAVDPPPRLLLV